MATEKINFFGFSVERWYRHSRCLTKAQKGELIDGIVAFMEDDTHTIVDTMVLQRLNEMTEHLQLVKTRAINLKTVNTNNINKRWHKNDTTVLPSNENGIYDGYTKEKEKEKEKYKEKNNKESSPKGSRLIIPTLQEIKEYIKENGIDIDAEKFFYHYESTGWVRGKTPIKSWKACVRTWVHNSKPVSKPSLLEGLLDVE